MLLSTMIPLWTEGSQIVKSDLLAARMTLNLWQVLPCLRRIYWVSELPWFPLGELARQRLMCAMPMSSLTA